MLIIMDVDQGPTDADYIAISNNPHIYTAANSFQTLGTAATQNPGRTTVLVLQHALMTHEH